MPWRIALGVIWHETNTFAAGLTGLDAFRAYQYALGDEMLCRYAGTNTELGGMITTAKELGFELVPTIYAGAATGGAAVTTVASNVDAPAGTKKVRLSTSVPVALVSTRSHEPSVNLNSIRTAGPSRSTLLLRFDPAIAVGSGK